VPPVSRFTTPVDAVLGIALAGAAVAETLANTEAPHPGVRAVFAAVATLSVVVRRTHPALAASVYAAAITVESLTTESPDEASLLIVCLLIAYSVAAHAPRREAMLGLGLMALALAASIATDPSDSVSNIPLSVLLFVGLPSALGLAMRRRQQDIAALTLETEALTREADSAVEMERRRIARELHDVVSHAVTLIAVQAEAGQAVIEKDPGAARRSLESIGQVSREALNELSRLLAVLHEEPTQADAGTADIDTLVAGVRATGMRVDLDTDPADGLILDPAVDRCAYRVVQEALTNALRHTSGGKAIVQLRRRDRRLILEVRTEGQAHSSSYGGAGRGLNGLRERVMAVGGSFEASPDGQGAFVVRAELPELPEPVAEVTRG
jgi:signal transduction histidine kinase